MKKGFLPHRCCANVRLDRDSVQGHWPRLVISKVVTWLLQLIASYFAYFSDRLVHRALSWYHHLVVLSHAQTPRP